MGFWGFGVKNFRTFGVTGPVGLTVLNAHLGVASDMVCFCRRFQANRSNGQS